MLAWNTLFGYITRYFSSDMFGSLPSKAQSLAPKKTVTAARCDDTADGMRRGRTILAHLVL